MADDLQRQMEEVADLILSRRKEPFSTYSPPANYEVDRDYSGIVFNDRIREILEMPTYTESKATRAGIYDLVKDAEDPRAELPRVNAASYLAERTGYPAQYVYENLDAVGREWFGRELPPASLWQEIKNVWNTNVLLAQLGHLYSQQVWGQSNPELEAQIQELESQMPSPTEYYNSIPAKILKGAAAFAPYIIDGMNASMAQGLVGGSAGALAGSIAAAVGGASLTPLAAIVIPAIVGGYAIGQLVGGFQNSASVEGGLAYREYRQLVDEDGVPIPDELAKQGAKIVGLINGTIEVAQLGMIAGVGRGAGKVLGKMLPNEIVGGAAFLRAGAQEAFEKVIPSAMRRASQRILASRALHAPIVRIATAYGTNLVGNAIEEFAQEVSTIATGEIIKEIANSEYGSQFNRGDMAEIRTRLSETFVDALLGGVLIVGPGAISEAAGKIAQDRAIESEVSTVVERARAEGEELRVQEASEEDTGGIPKETLEQFPRKEAEQIPYATTNEVVEADEATGEVKAKFTATDPQSGDVVMDMDYETTPEGELVVTNVSARTVAEGRRAMQMFASEHPGVEIDFANTPRGALLKDAYHPESTAQIGGSLEDVQFTATPVTNVRTLEENLRTHFPQFTSRETSLAVRFVEARAAKLQMPADDWVKQFIHPEAFISGVDLKGNRAAARFLNEGRAAFYLTKSSDLSSWIHEVSHIIRRQIPVSERKAIEQWAGVESPSAWHRDAEEKFVAGLMGYLKTGELPDQALAGAFRGITEWLREFWDTADTAIGAQIPEEVRTEFSSLFAAPMSSPIEAAAPEAEAALPKAPGEELELYQGEIEPFKAKVFRGGAPFEATERSSVSWRDADGNPVDLEFETAHYSDDEGVAATYGDVTSGEISFANPLTLNARGASWDSFMPFGKIAEAYMAGHDGVIIRNLRDEASGRGKRSTVYVSLSGERVSAGASKTVADTVRKTREALPPAAEGAIVRDEASGEISIDVQTSARLIAKESRILYEGIEEPEVDRAIIGKPLSGTLQFKNLAAALADSGEAVRDGDRFESFESAAQWAAEVGYLEPAVTKRPRRGAVDPRAAWVALNGISGESPAFAPISNSRLLETIELYFRSHGMEATRNHWPQYRIEVDASGSLRAMAPETPKGLTVQAFRPARGADAVIGLGGEDGGAFLSRPELTDAILEADPASLTLYTSGIFSPPQYHPLSRRTVIGVELSGAEPIGETLARVRWAEIARSNGWTVVLRDLSGDDGRLAAALDSTDFLVVRDPVGVELLYPENEKSLDALLTSEIPDLYTEEEAGRAYGSREEIEILSQEIDSAIIATHPRVVGEGEGRNRSGASGGLEGGRATGPGLRRTGAGVRLESEDSQLLYQPDGGSWPDWLSPEGTVPGSWRKLRRVDFRGTEIPDASGLAQILQIVRHPRLEHFHILLVDDAGTVLANHAISSGLPSASKATRFNNATKHVYRLRDQMRRAGASGYYLAHNHPGGDPTPSPDDQSVTRGYAGAIPGFLGHIVIDHDRYGVIDEFGDYQVRDLPGEPGPDFTENTGPAIRSQRDIASVAELARQRYTADTFVITTTNRNRIVSVHPVQYQDLPSQSDIHTLVQSAGAARAMVATVNPEIYQRMVRDVLAIRGRIHDRVVDVVLLDESSATFHSGVTDGYFDRYPGHEDAVMASRPATSWLWEQPADYRPSTEVLIESALEYQGPEFYERLNREALTFSTFEEFRDYMETMGGGEELAQDLEVDTPSERDAKYRELWEQAKASEEAKKKPKSREEANAEFLEDLSTPEALNGWLEPFGWAWQGRQEQKKAKGLLPPLMFAQALRAGRKQLGMSERAFRSIYGMLKKDPTRYRMLYAEVTQDSEAMQGIAAEEGYVQPTDRLTLSREAESEAGRLQAVRPDVTITQIDDQVVKLEEDIAGLRAEFREYVRSARSEARATARMLLERRRELRDKQKLRTHILKMAKYITKPLPASYPIAVRRQAEYIAFSIDPAFHNDETMARREEIRERLRKSAGRQGAFLLPDEEEALKMSLNELSQEQLEQLANEVQRLREMGKALRDARVAEIKARREAIVTRMVQTLLSGSELGIRYGVGYEEDEKLKSRKAAQAFLETMWDRPERLLLKLDGGKPGIFTRVIWDRMNEITDTGLRRIDERQSRIRDKMKELGVTWHDLRKKITVSFDASELEDLYEKAKRPRVGADGWVKVTATVQDAMYWYLGIKNPETHAAIMYGKRIGWTGIAAGIQSLTENQKAFANFIGEELEENWWRIRDAFEADKNIEMGHVAGAYVPMWRQEMSGEAIGMELAKEMANLNAWRKAFPDKRFTKERIKGIAPEFQRPIRTDLVQIALQAVEQQEHYIAGWEFSKDLQYVADSQDFSEAMRQVKGDEYLTWMKKYLNDFASPNAGRDYSALDKAASVLQKNMGSAYLGFSVSTILQQFTSVPLFLAYADPVHLTAAALKYALNYSETTQFAYESDPQLKHRVIEQFITQMKTMKQGRVGTAITRVQEVGLAPIEIVDRMLATIGWVATYDTGRARGMSHEAAVRYAQNAVLRTQSAARMKDLPQAYRNKNPFFKFFQIFTNQLNQQWNIVVNDLPTAVRNHQWLSAMGHVVGTALAILGVALVTDRELPEDWKELAIWFAEGLASFVPFVGKSLESGMRGFRSSGVTPVKLADSIGYAAYVAMDVDREAAEKVQKILEAAWEGASVTFGIPYSQVRKVFRAVDERDWGQVISRGAQ